MTKSKATEIGDILKQSLGEGWEIEIDCDKINWYVSATNGALTVTARLTGTSGKATYSCFLARDSKSPHTDLPLWGSESLFTQQIHTDPKQAVVEKVHIARATLNELNATVNIAEKVMANFKCDCCGRGYTS